MDGLRQICTTFTAAPNRGSITAHSHCSESSLTVHSSHPDCVMSAVLSFCGEHEMASVVVFLPLLVSADLDRHQLLV